jgi:replicative DNA helicase
MITDSKILMYDGSFKKVEHICIGDCLMGGDSRKKEVLEIIPNKDFVYKIVPKRNGNLFNVSRNHVLSLKSTGNSYGNINNDIVNISVNDFLHLNYKKRKYLIGYRLGVDFKEMNVDLDPYFLGLWLGDGSSERPLISTGDFEIVNFLNEMLKSNYPNLKITSKTKGNCQMLNIHGQRIYPNEIKNELRRLNLLFNKHIPNSYKINNKIIRLQVLAGLLDSDGTNTCDYYVIYTKFDKLNEDICFLARSLGFGVNSRMGGPDRKYHIISITGDTYTIPVKIKRKKQFKKNKARNALKFGFEIYPMGEKDGLNFKLDKNNLVFLDDFTIINI